MKLGEVLQFSNGLAGKESWCVNIWMKYCSACTLQNSISNYNIHTLDELSKLSIHDFGIFIDLEPEIPSVIIQGFYANLYNSTLSAFSTPIKAIASNGKAEINIIRPYLIRSFRFSSASAAKREETIIKRCIIFTRNSFIQASIQKNA